MDLVDIDNTHSWGISQALFVNRVWNWPPRYVFFRVLSMSGCGIGLLGRFFFSALSISVNSNDIMSTHLFFFGFMEASDRV